MKKTVILFQPDRVPQMLKPYDVKFGSGFQQRVQEDVRCYEAHAYLKSCDMCGAAAESALLATANCKESLEK